MILRSLIIILCASTCLTQTADKSRSGKKRRETRHTMVVGAIFESDDEVQEIAFKKALEAANSRLAGSASLWKTSLTPSIERIETGNSFAANKAACKMLEVGVVAIVGPSSPLVSNHVQTICDTYGIPHFELQWGYRESNAIYSVNLHPNFGSFGRAILQYVAMNAEVDGLAIIYYQEEGLLKFTELLNVFKQRIMIRRWSLDPKFIKNLKESNTKRFIVDIPAGLAKDFLAAASTFNLTTNYYSYIFTSWDLTMVDLRAFRLNNGANITTFMITPYITNNESYDLGENIEELRKEIHKTRSVLDRFADLNRLIPTKAALIYDSIQLLANALISLSKARSVRVTQLSCSSKGSWAHGASLVNYIKSNDAMTGLTGDIRFDKNRIRSNFTLNIYEADRKLNFIKFGNWTLGAGVTVVKNFSKTRDELLKEIQKTVLRVTTIDDAPFAMVAKKDKYGRPLTSPDGWEGFCIELMAEIAKQSDLNYTIHLVKDLQYGKKNGTGPNGPTWNGMIGELMRGEADLALASLTITYERERVIDFTTPYMNLGLTILFKKPKASNPHLFSFLSPLSPPVWGYVVAAYVLVSGILFVVARFSPYEWFNPHPCNSESDVVENQFNVANSFWFTIASFLQQGSEHAPKSTSTRIVAGIWWFFGLIVISSYTANLAAFLTVERMKSPIESVEDLSKQTRIKYGTLQSGSTYSFFENNVFKIYKTMFEFMKSNENTFVENTKQGIQRVHEGDYAFILESTMNEYYRARNCSLIQIGDKLDSKGYGIGLPRGSQYRDLISESILRLQKSQVIDKLKKKYWYRYNIKKPCNTDKKSGSANSLRVEQVGGVFVVLLVGMLMAIICSICEFLYKTRKNAVKDHNQEHVCTELGKELRFAMRCMTSSKKTVNKSQDDVGLRGAAGDSSSRMRMLMEPPPSMMRDERGSGRWYSNDERYGVNGTQLDHTPRYSPKYPVVGNMSPYPASADFNYSDSRFKKVPC